MNRASPPDQRSGYFSGKLTVSRMGSTRVIFTCNRSLRGGENGTILGLQQYENLVLISKICN